MHPDRLQRLRTAMTQARLDCAAAIAGPNLFYLTGLSFHLSERPTTGFFPAQGDPVIVAGSLEESKVASGAPYPLRGCYYSDAAGPVLAYREAAQTLRLGGRGQGMARLGVETRRMRVMELRLIEDAFLNPRVDAAEELFAGLRMIKDASELAHMRRAVEIAERALLAALPAIQVGQTERGIAAELVVQTLRAGSDADLPFTPIVASGPNSGLPHATVTDRALQPGDLLTLDWGASSGGYMADLTRTFAIGAIEPELRAIYNLVLAANEAARAATRPGRSAADIDAAARRVITTGGYGDYFVHRLGHGLGLEGHEDPSMHGQNETSLAPGMTFTIEPGIYLPGRGGVRIEDDVVVTAGGVESLSTLPRELQVIGV
ncbi:MAG: aminopeptidase P family protein [Anaerolineales bacterium]|nr:aminopeptidase P family protein [Anaerolineales bacterium]